MPRIARTVPRASITRSAVALKWSDGTLRGKRHRKSLNTGDYKKALRRIASLESDTSLVDKPIKEAIDASQNHVQNDDSTKLKYFRPLRQLKVWADADGVDLIRELDFEAIDRFFASRKTARSTRVREIQTLRTFFGFCLKRA